MMKFGFFLILTASLFSSYVDGLVAGIYCGERNCYDVLNVARNCTFRDISRAYRNLARVYHPDKHLDPDDKKNAQQKFLEIATAYDVLKEEESRKDYDYMLDNPEEMYKHYWRYYRRKVVVDVKVVLFITISIISVVQYYAALSKYNEAINYFLTVPKYRIKAQEIAKSEGLLQSSNPSLKRKNRSKTKEQIKRDEELILRNIIEDKMDIKGSCSKPTYYDVLWVQLFFLPVYIYKFLLFQIKWFYKFNYCKMEYGDEEKLYLIRKNMKLSQGEFNQLDEDEIEYFLSLNLWEKKNFSEWKKEEDERNRAKLAELSSHKRYRRWMKKGGPGSLSFMED